MKKIKCQKCGHEIILGIDDEERLFICCDRLMKEVKETVLYGNADPKATKSMIAKQPCNDFVEVREE